MNYRNIIRKDLRSTTAVSAIALMGAMVAMTPAARAAGQEAPAPVAAQSTSANAAQRANDADMAAEEIVVTGSILRRTDTETPSPVTILSTQTLEQRGINTVAEALQRLGANGSGTVSEGWNNGNNFAAGSNAVSLRGLTVQKTLTVFDGLRMAPYPLADDGHRNFVDLNSIPDAIVDRIEVLRDGASSTYGADAVAGVVNVITKKQVQGVHVNASTGISHRGDGAEQRIDLTAGYGDLADRGFNLYVNGTYRKNDVIWARDRDYPFGSGDLSGICNDAGSCMAIPTRGYTFGVNANGTLGGSTTPVAPIVAPGTAAGARTGLYQLLNPDCGAFASRPVTLPATAAGAVYSPNLCQQDLKEAYQTVRPDTERYGISARATVRIGDNAEAYIAGNYMHAHSYAQLAPLALNSQTPPPGGVPFGTVVLPVYVCATGVGTIDPTTGVNTSAGCNAQNGTLNPNNPFAAAGDVAILRARYDRPLIVEANSRTLRGAAGINGTFGADEGWKYQLEFTASEVRLDRISRNYLIPQRLADVIATGTYNFAQPWLNSQEVRDYISPTSVKTSTSNLWQVSGMLGRSLFELPGGPLQVALGASYRHEAIDDKSANPENIAHPYDRYYGINAVGAVGSRNMASAFFEIGAPIMEQFELNLSGRYDDYSSGQSNFSPKVGAKLKPIDQLLLRGTWSKGFRIPSFNEAYGLPTTGYTTLAVNCTTYAEFCASHQNNSYVTGQYSLGRTSEGNPALDPEKSTSWTLGAVFEPVRGVSFTLDYFNIKVRNVIGSISAEAQTAALDAYLRSGNMTAVPGIVVVPGVADAQFPTARPLPGFVQFSFQNAGEERVQGIDFGLDVRKNLGGVQLHSSLEASYLIKYEVQRGDGSVERYDGTLSPCDYTSCSGSPSWRGSWQNTLSAGDLAVTGTVYYTSGYELGSVDYGGVRGGDCSANIGQSVVTYQDGTPVKCRVGATWNADLAASYKVNGNLTLYANVLNFLDLKPQFDPSAAYSIFQYNPAWGQPNIVGRYFRFGARLTF
jgi:iron complex outermembrane receptor protein